VISDQSDKRIQAEALWLEMTLHHRKLAAMIAKPDPAQDQQFWDALAAMRECVEDFGDAVEMAWCQQQEAV
jgi:hypothetical protein